MTRQEFDTLEQLDDRAAGHLLSDSTHANANVSLIQIHDQRSAPGGVVRFKSILAQIENRLHRWPRARQRLQRVPLGIDRPYWVDDDMFDLEHHVRHIALPKPGDWRQFCIQTSRLHARALDMDRPLWELYVIEGLDSFLDLPPGSFAVLIKTHLAVLEMSDLAKLTEGLCDPQAKPAAAPPPPSWFADSAPGPLALLQRGMWRSALTPWQLPWVAQRMLPAARILAGGGLAEVQPMTRFNSVVSPYRVFETRRFAIGEFEQIAASVPGATLEDAVIAVCGGALRRYLIEQGELPANATLNAMTWHPGKPEGSSGKRGPASWRPRPLATDVEDPGEALVAVASSATKYREAVPQAIRPALMGGQMPGEVSTHCVIRFIPAPERTQYLCGAHMSYTSAILPVRDGMGLAFAVTRYEGLVNISPTACRELVPDPERFAQCLRDSFQDSLARAQQHGSSRPPALASEARPRGRKK
ncbi:MAG: wax ester/triacylglycerol synthase family O-acyltransferase [Ottowia sp.]|uniref:wax ester/triacylglycerol synthase domain-containing protein n=1 Tax=Ottowia sp. TaxID=1898956 RepID=UPI0039E4C806